MEDNIKKYLRKWHNVYEKCLNSTIKALRPIFSINSRSPPAWASWLPRQVLVPARGVLLGEIAPEARPEAEVAPRPVPLVEPTAPIPDPEPLPGEPVEHALDPPHPYASLTPSSV